MDLASRVPVEIDDISPAPTHSTKADPKTLGEQRYLEEAHLASFKQDTMHRAVYAPKIFWLVVAWMIGIFVLLFFQGFHFFSFDLSNSVLIAVITGTTATVLGMLVIVAKYIFSHERDPSS